MEREKVLILGGGFGGLKAARELKDADVDLILVDRKNHHLFQPLLYQVATCALAPRDIAFPIREIVKHQKNTTVIMDEATKILPEEKAVLFASGRRLEYDRLIIAIGARHTYFGHEEWEQYAPGLKTLTDARMIRNQILKAFESAEASQSHEDVDRYLTFVVVGGGATGVELAGAIAEIANKTMIKNFRRIDPKKTRVYLLEALDHVLPSYPEDLSKRAEADLKKIGVTVRTKTLVKDVFSGGLIVGEGEKIEAETILWAAGNKASDLLNDLDVPTDKQNRIIVGPDLSVPGHPEIFVIGDAARYEHGVDAPLPAVAPVAVQQGKYVGNLLAKKLQDKEHPPFHYRDRGQMATIGKAHAVASVWGRHFTGLFAWLLWTFVHIAFLIGFRRRFVVMLEWMFWYVTENRGSRLIH